MTRPAVGFVPASSRLALSLSLVLACSGPQPAAPSAPRGADSAPSLHGDARPPGLTRADLAREADAIERSSKAPPPPRLTASTRERPPPAPRPFDAPAGAAPLQRSPGGGMTLHATPSGEPAKAAPSSGAPPPAPAARLELGLGGDVRAVQRGLSPGLGATREARRRGFGYAFLILDGSSPAAAEQALGEAGVALLGPHDGAVKARVPLERERLQRVTRLPFVRAVVTAAPDHKLERRLRDVAQQIEAAAPSLPVMINAFDGLALKELLAWLSSAGAAVGRVNTGLSSVAAVVSPEQLRALASLDGVLWIELAVPEGPGHDQSMPALGVDYIRPAAPGSAVTGERFSGASVRFGILDTGFMAGKGRWAHRDLDKFGCGLNFTADAGGAWHDAFGHGTHVLATAIGSGLASAIFRGVAPGVGSTASAPLRAAKIWSSAGYGTEADALRGYRFMRDGAACGPVPQVVNLSGGSSAAPWSGTDERSRELDQSVWEARQTWVVCAGNSGPEASTLWSPGVAKNALTVGNVLDHGAGTVGTVDPSSSRGPTRDGRIKPNVVAPGQWVLSARAGTRDEYVNQSGCSMATPHVSGLVATLLEHYPEWDGHPELLRAHLMATALLGDTGGASLPVNNTPLPGLPPSSTRAAFGLGQVSPYVAHWNRDNPRGWLTRHGWATITSAQSASLELEVPAGASRLVVVATWDEPPASAGASRAVSWDLDLWVTHASCVPAAGHFCGEWASQSSVDNVEYQIVDAPAPGPYRVTIANVRAPATGLPAAVSALVILGQATPDIELVVSEPRQEAAHTFSVTTTVAAQSWLLAGVHVGLEAPGLPPGVTLTSLRTTREDGVEMMFGAEQALTLGTIVEGGGRSATWTFEREPGAAGVASWLAFRATSWNGSAPARSVAVMLPPATTGGARSARRAPSGAGAAVTVPEARRAP